MRRLAMGALILASVTGCSTITTGTTQNLTVTTPRVDGATCDLTDSKGGKWFIKDTPNTVTVRKGDGPMTIICKKDGYKTNTLMLEEGFHGATLGNVLLGGGIGIFVDIASGAAQKYPDQVVMWLEPEKWDSEEEKAAWEAEKAEYQKKIEEEKAAQNQSARPPRN